MIRQIKRSDYPDYMSYLDAICEPIGGADSHIVWDEDEEEWVLDQEHDNDDDSNHAHLPPSVGRG